MPELQEQMFCSQQIVVPPKFPYILKRYCKAAIKTQPYDLLRWSFEYFKALAQHRPPPVKLRLEYPIYSTEGGLTRGCLKVLANQLISMKELPLPVVKAAWQGFCLDCQELNRIFCLCEVYMRHESVPFLHFIAVAAGLLTKCLTHTMILLCESLTKEPDGGSAAIPVQDFLVMYKFLAAVDGSKDVKYCDGYREGEEPPPETIPEEEQEPEPEPEYNSDSDEYWEKSERTQKLSLIDARVSCGNNLSYRTIQPVLGKIKRSPSMEIAAAIEWDNYQRERKGKPHGDAEIDKKLRDMSTGMVQSHGDLTGKESTKEPTGKEEEKKDGIEIIVQDEDENQIPYEFYGEPPPQEYQAITEEDEEVETEVLEEQEPKDEVKLEPTEKEKVMAMLDEVEANRRKIISDVEETFDEIAAIVDKFKSAGYDLGMVAGRMMSTTSGEFIVAHIERELMDYVNDQIAILPDPDLKKKKAKPEEVMMIRQMLNTWLAENLEVIVPEVEEVEEEEQAMPDIVVVYAVPGIGPPVDHDTVLEFEEYVMDACKVQADLVMPRNIRHFLCPPLEKYQEINYEKGGRGEEVPVPTGGAIDH